jgi:hypothetical protein
MPRDFTPKLAHTARDQHCPAGSKTSRLARTRASARQPRRQHRTMPQRKLRL